MTTKNRTIYITAADMVRLRSLVDSLKSSREDLKSLKDELDLARVVDASEIPPDIITMRSKARLSDVNEGDEMTFTLVFPNEADVDAGKISVLAPIGTAMLGRRVHDNFSWEVPSGKVRIKVEEVLYQPEAAGHYHL